MSVEMKTTEQGANAELSAVLEGLKSIEGATGEQKSKVEAIFSDIMRFEEKNKELTLSAAETAKELKAAQERLETLELSVSQKSIGSSDYKESPEYKALNLAMKNGLSWEQHLNAEQKSLLRTDVGTSGGFLVPDAIDAKIRSKITEVSDIRRLADASTVTTKSLSVVIDGEAPYAPFEGETESGTQVGLDAEEETVTLYSQRSVVKLTDEQINFTPTDMVSHMEKKVVRGFIAGEGNGFLNGTGVKMPKGVLKTASVPTYETAAANKLSFTDVVDLKGELKKSYHSNAVYFMSPKTYVKLRLELETGGNGLFWKQNSDGPNTIDGTSYVLMPDMADVTGLTGQSALAASGDIVVGLGDFFTGYQILDLEGTKLVINPYSQDSEAIIKYTWKRWLTGQVQMPEAFALLKIKA